MAYNSPFFAVSTWMTFFVQIACGYLLTFVLAALFRSHRVRLRLWTCFLLVTVFGWIFLSVPTPAGRPRDVPTLAAQVNSAPHWSWPVSNSLVPRLERLGAWATWIYLLILTISLLQLLAKRLRLDLLLRNRQYPSPELLLLFDTLCQEMKVRGCELSLLAQLRSPATVGFLRPQVLLPMELVPRLDSDHLVQILRHELIHVKRHDYLWDRFSAIGCRILFFHPSVWFAYRRIRWERELACDQAVVENSWDSRLPYAECLTGLARWWFIAEKTSSRGIGFSSSSSLLTTRIREILHEPRRISIFEWGLRTGLIAVMVIVGFVFLPNVALTLYRSESPFRAARLPTALLGSRPPSSTPRKGTSVQKRRTVPLQASDAPVRATEQDQTLNTLLSSTPAPMPILGNLPTPTSDKGADKTSSGQDQSGHRAESSEVTGVWDESSAPTSRPTSPNLSETAIDAIRIGLANVGGHGSNSEGSGGEQGNHLQ
jgi:beta-lactamase regulating signal transducer with metallopeptidase domain